jgi:hypothetical protein
MIKLWRALTGVLSASRSSDGSLQTCSEVILSNAVHETFPDLCVRHGVFQGMRYPEAQAVGSELFPKLLGRYEHELSGIMRRAVRCNYSEIVNIGCAEGYYAIGLAMLLPSASVYAFDIDAAALILCRRMATVNGVGHRIVLRTFCDPAVLMGLPIRGRALILSDCEGYERFLFTAAVARFLERHDVLIEVHDFIDNSISGRLRHVFAQTHNLHIINSVEDRQKLTEDVEPELNRYNRETQLFLIAERRPAPMQWFFFTPRRKLLICLGRFLQPPLSGLS